MNELCSCTEKQEMNPFNNMTVYILVAFAAHFTGKLLIKII